MRKREAVPRRMSLAGVGIIGLLALVSFAAWSRAQDGQRPDGEASRAVAAADDEAEPLRLEEAERRFRDLFQEVERSFGGFVEGLEQRFVGAFEPLERQFGEVFEELEGGARGKRLDDALEDIEKRLGELGVEVRRLRGRTLFLEKRPGSATYKISLTLLVAPSRLRSAPAWRDLLRQVPSSAPCRGTSLLLPPANIRYFRTDKLRDRAVCLLSPLPESGYSYAPDV